jgi:polyribonucleotide 5'-hydroxyl-kinase
MSIGPRVLVVGPADAGKSTISRILLNYSIRRDRPALYVDLDVGQGSIAVPGALAAVQMLRPLDVQHDFAESNSPLAHFYGSTSVGDNTKLFRLTVDRFAADINKRFAKLPEFAAHGFIANMFGWVEGVGYQMMMHCIQSLAADVVLVVGDERLFNDLRSKLTATVAASVTGGSSSLPPAAPPSVIYVPRSGGVVQRSAGRRRTARANRIREYFYGPENLLAPHSTQVLASDVVLLRVGGSPQAPSSALPIGAEHRIDPAELEEVEADSSIVNSLAAVSFAQTREEVDTSAVAGFIYIQEVLGEEKKRLRIVTPCAGPLPSKFILLSSIQWQEI